VKRIWIGIAVALPVVIAVGIIADPSQVVMGKLAGEAFFQERPTRYWARALRADPAKQADALAALEQGHAAAVPVLVEILRGSPAAADAELRWKSVELLAKLGPDAASAASAVTAGVNDPDSHVQAVCAEALPKLEAPAESAVPALISQLKTDNVVVAERALSRYRGAAAPAVPELIALLKDKQQKPEARWNAARTIGKTGPEAIGALDALIESIEDEEWHIREHCAEAIGELGSAAAEKGVPVLIERLSDDAVRVRRDAVRSLGQLGDLARAAVPQVEKLLEDKEEIVREAAQKALRLIASDQEKTVGEQDDDDPKNG
jgi:HEAT repeat protein